MLRPALLTVSLSCAGPVSSAPGGPLDSDTRLSGRATAAVVLLPRGIPATWQTLRDRAPGHDICKAIRRTRDSTARTRPVDPDGILTALQAHQLCPGTPG